MKSIDFGNTQLSTNENAEWTLIIIYIMLFLLLICWKRSILLIISLIYFSEFYFKKVFR